MPFTLKKYAELKGWKYNKLIATGEEQGYLFTIVQGQGFKTFFTSLVNSSESDKASVLAFLNEQKKILKISEVEFDNSVLIVKVKETLSQLKEADLNNILFTLTNYFRQNNIDVEKHCVFCSQPNVNTTCQIQGIGYHAHQECYEKAIGERQQAVKEYDSLEKNYLKGTIGALVGGLLASIIWIIVSSFGWFVAFIGYLIAKGALKGYESLGGRLGSLTRWIILGVVVISVAIAEFATWIVLMITEGKPVNAESIQYVFSDPEVISSFLTNLGIGLVFAFLGIFSLFKDLKGDGNSVVAEIK